MIRHICMFTLKEDNKEDSIKEFITKAQSLNEINTVKRLEVVSNAKGTPDSNYDVALIVDFDTVEALDEYQTSEIHLKFGAFVATVKEQRACIDYEF